MVCPSQLDDPFHLTRAVHHAQKHLALIARELRKDHFGRLAHRLKEQHFIE
jgi:hypothetical protein